MKVGIVGYGVFVPRFRLKVEEIWDMWQRGFPPASIKELYGVEKKAVARWDEDVITMAIDAAKISLKISGVASDRIGALFLGTSTNPYVTKPSTPIILQSLGLGPNVLCSDIQFAGKSGTSALMLCIGLTSADMIEYGLAIGSDNLSKHVAPNDLPLEYLAGSGGAAFIVGKDKVVAETENLYSYTTDLPDFFRLDGDRYLKRAISSTEEWAGYTEHIRDATGNFLKKFDYKPGDFEHVVFNQPDGKLPKKVGTQIGFSEKQMVSGLVSRKIGDCGSASALIGLAAALDVSNPGDRILVSSYGYGGGCDVFCFKTTDWLADLRKERDSCFSVHEIVESGLDIDFKQYLRMERKVIQEYV